LNAIAAALRCNVGDATTDAISRAITERLKGTGGLLILDEAQHLGFASIEQIRIIAEKAEIGVALLGNTGIYSQMGGGRRSSGFDQLRSRIAKRLELRAMTLEDVRPIAEMFGVRGEADLSLLARIARGDGALRDVVNVLQTILIEHDDGEISSDRIIETWHELSGELLRPQRPADRTPKPEVARIGRAG
jgi:DNA transposition AAA+ family ATPase